MTLWDLFGLALRRWPIVLGGAICTAAVAFAAIQDDGVYWTRTQVVFLAPPSELYPNSLETRSESLVITAGLVAKEINGPGKVTKYGSSDVSLVGLGVRRGWSVRLPDSGGQWAPNFSEQVLIAEVVGETVEEVEHDQEALFELIAGELYDMQRDMGVAPVNDVTVTVAPESTVIYHVSGSRSRAVGMAGMLGAGATVAGLFTLEMRARRRWLREQRDTPTTAIPIVLART